MLSVVVAIVWGKGVLAKQGLSICDVLKLVNVAISLEDGTLSKDLK